METRLTIIEALGDLFCDFGFLLESQLPLQLERLEMVMYVRFRGFLL